MLFRSGVGNDYQYQVQDPYSPQFSISDITDTHHEFLKNKYERNLLNVSADESAYENKYDSEDEDDDDEEDRTRRNGTDDMYEKNSRSYRFNLHADSCCYIDFQTKRKNDEEG